MRFFYIVAAAVLVMLPVSGQVDAREAVKHIVVPDDVQVELVVAEPQVMDPVALCFDASGVLYVVENGSYPTNEDKLGKVVCLTDENGDGYHETRKVFAEGFAYPNGIMAWRDGFLVTDAPEVWFLKDGNGDGVAEERSMVLTGFSEGGSTQLRVSHPTLGLDNWIYFSNGLSGGKVKLVGQEDVLDMGVPDLRWDPKGQRVERTGGRAQFGLSFNDRGHKFVCNNRKHVEHVVMSLEDRARNPYLPAGTVVADIPEHGGASEIYSLSNARTTAYAHHGTFTAACGLLIYRGSAMGDDYYGNSFTCDPTGALVHRDILEPNGATYIARRGHEGKEFLASADDWFRPVFLANGPDGAMYLCDMYRETIEHPTYLPKEVAEITDFYQGNDLGRIYRVTGKGAKPTASPPLSNLDDQVNALGHANAWVRETGQRLLLESLDKEVVPMLEKVLEGGNALAKTHALHLLEAHKALTVQQLLTAHDDESSIVREQAVALGRNHPEWREQLFPKWSAMNADVDPRVRFSVACALGDGGELVEIERLATILRVDIDDSWLQSAVLSGVGEDADKLIEALLVVQPDAREGWLTLMQSLGQLLAKSSKPAKVVEQTRLVDKLDSQDGLLPWWLIAYLNGVYSGVQQNKAFSEGVNVLERFTRANTEKDVEAMHDGLLDWLTLMVDKAGDPAVPLAYRKIAIEHLGFGPLEISRNVLPELLSPKHPPEIQLVAAQALLNMNDSLVAPLVLDGKRWGAYTPAIKTAVLNGVLSRSERLIHLIEAMESGQVPPWSLSPVMRNRILRTRDADLKVRAQTVFKDVKVTDRSAIYEEYKPVLKLKPNPEQGREVFQRLCYTCHLFKGDGYTVGPDLSGISSQPLESILLHILVPNSLLLEGYENYLIETADLEDYAGLIVAETPESITLRQPLGLEVTIDRSTITSMTTTSLSMMPEELEKSMTSQELRDLIGYLKGEKTSEK